MPITTKMLLVIATMNEPSRVAPRLPNKSGGGVADGGHIEFLKMLISPYWMKTFAQNLV